VTGQQVGETLHVGRRAYGMCLTDPSVGGVPRYDQLDFASIENERSAASRRRPSARFAKPAASHPWCGYRKSADPVVHSSDVGGATKAIDGAGKWY